MKINLLRSLPKLFMVWLLIAVVACNSDDPAPVPVGSAGYFIMNEGGFGASNTSLSFYDRGTNTVTNDVFGKKNGRGLGDQAQSVTVFEGKAYIAVQNSGKVEVINADDFSSIKTITEGLESPRYFLGINSSKGYVSDWGADGTTGTVKVIDLTTNTVTKTIATGQGANKMILRDGQVWVANDGGYGQDTKVTVIDTKDDSIMDSIEVGVNPNSLLFDAAGNLWVISIGDYNEIPASITRIGKDKKETFSLGEVTYSYPSLAINKAGDKIYYNYNGGVYAIASNATALPKTPLIAKDFYGLAVDPITDEIIGADAIDFSSNGKIYVYSPAGAELRSYEVGIAPNGVGFK